MVHNSFWTLPLHLRDEQGTSHKNVH